jgi:hypothetical protein
VTYGFSVANSSVGNMSVVVVARVLNGLVNMLLYAPGSMPSGLPDDTSRTLYQNLASSEKFVYVPAGRLRPGNYFVKLTAYSGGLRSWLLAPATAGLAAVPGTAGTRAPSTRPNLSQLGLRPVVHPGAPPLRLPRRAGCHPP